MLQVMGVLTGAGVIGVSVFKVDQWNGDLVQYLSYIGFGLMCFSVGTLF